MGLGLEMFRVFRFGHVFEHTCLTPEFANLKRNTGSVTGKPLLCSELFQPESWFIPKYCCLKLKGTCVPDVDGSYIFLKHKKVLEIDTPCSQFSLVRFISSEWAILWYIEFILYLHIIWIYILIFHCTWHIPSDPTPKKQCQLSTSYGYVARHQDHQRTTQGPTANLSRTFQANDPGCTPKIIRCFSDLFGKLGIFFVFVIFFGSLGSFFLAILGNPTYYVYIWFRYL